jgi:stage V sporulation protein R
MGKAREIVHDEDDFGFIRNYLDQQLADKLDLFVYETRKDGETRIANRDIHAIREAILAPKYNYGAPTVVVQQVGADGSLDLRHDYLHDGRGLDLQQAERVMEYVTRIWRRPVQLHTVDFRGVVRVLPARKVGF